MVSLSIYFISNVYAKWSETPVIVTMGASLTSITDLPFPAITICNVNKASASVATTFAPDSAESAWLQNLCYDEFENSSEANDGRQKGSSEWSVFRPYLLKMSQPCSQMLVSCKYAFDSYPCMELFDTVLSDEGLCCIFNPVNPTFLYVNPTNNNFGDDEEMRGIIEVDWTPELGYVNSSIKKISVPRPAVGMNKIE